MTNRMIGKDEKLRVRFKNAVECNGFKPGQMTIAYKSYYKASPSGRRLHYLVWDEAAGRCTAQKADRFEIVEVIKR